MRHHGRRVADTVLFQGEAQQYAAQHWPERLVNPDWADLLTVCLPRPEHDSPTGDMRYPYVASKSSEPCLMVAATLSQPIATALGPMRIHGLPGMAVGKRDPVMAFDALINEHTITHDLLEIHEMQEGHGARTSSMINCFYCGVPLLAWHAQCLGCQRPVYDQDLHNRYPFWLPPKIVRYLKDMRGHSFESRSR